MTSASRAIRRLLRINAGMLIWASALVFLYAGRSLACPLSDVSPDTGLAHPVTALLLTLALLHLAVLGWLGWRWFQHPAPAIAASEERVELFCHRLEGLVLALSVTAVLWLAAPILMVPPCQG